MNGIDNEINEILDQYVVGISTLADLHIQVDLLLPPTLDLLTRKFEKGMTVPVKIIRADKELILSVTF